MTHRHNWIDITTMESDSEVRKCFECGMVQTRKFGTDRWIRREPEVLPLGNKR